MQKRGQISLFLIVGIVILLVSGLFMMIKRPNADRTEQALRQDYLAVESYINSCLERGLLSAEDLGLRDDLKAQHEALIDSELKKCSDFSVFKGVSIISGIAKSEVSLTDDSFSVSAKYPIMILRENSRIGIDRFRSQISREIDVTLENEKVIVAPDRKAELKIRDGFLLNNLPIWEAGIRIVDSGLENAGSETVAGGVAFRILPDKAEKENGATLTLKYNDANLPVSESSLAIAYYNETSHLWEALQSNSDQNANKVSAEISRFGTYAVVYGMMSQNFAENKDYYDSQPNIPVDLENCFKGKLDQFPVRGSSSFMNDWGFSRVQGAHEGTDIMAPVGAEIVAAASGKITDMYCNKLGGNAIEISSGNGVSYYYAHMSGFGQFKIGDQVKAGDVIGYVGTTIGCQSPCSSALCGIPDQTIPHLHFGTYVNWKAQNPYCTLVAAKNVGTSSVSTSSSSGDVIVKNSPNKGPAMVGYRGVIIHSTRGGQVPGKELQATINWFSNPASRVSAHRNVGVNGENYKFVDEDIQAWHAGENNLYYLGIELEQGNINDPFTDKQYVVTAQIVREWSKKYGFQVNRQNVLGHEETEQGRRVGKTDPGPMFDWDKFMALANSD